MLANPTVRQRSVGSRGDGWNDPRRHLLGCHGPRCRARMTMRGALTMASGEPPMQDMIRHRLGCGRFRHLVLDHGTGATFHRQVRTKLGQRQTTPELL